MASVMGGRARWLIITGIVAAGIGAGTTGIALASTRGGTAPATTVAHTTSSSPAASSSPSARSLRPATGGRDGCQHAGSGHSGGPSSWRHA